MGELRLVSCEVWVGVLLCLAVYDMSYECTLPSACIYNTVYINAVVCLHVWLMLFSLNMNQ